MIPKFRAWDKEENRMIDDYEVLISSDGCAYYNHYEGGLRDLGFDVEIMQSTGIKDKNGVELYEGDILKLHAIFLAPDDKIGYLEYSPKYGYSIIFEGNRLYRQEYWASTNKLNYEVIGNIYENPELLREDTKND